MPLQLIRQDITKIHCDAIVDPSNNDLVPGGSTDLAIHEAAGKKLDEYCKKLGGCETGKAKVSPAFDLPCKMIIHTAGPYFEDEDSTRLLISCYKECLDLAYENKCESVAFPLISAGECGFPKDKVLKIAINTISSFLMEHEMMVYLALFDKRSYELGQKLFDIQAYIDDMYVFEHLDNAEEKRYIEKGVICGSRAAAPRGTRFCIADESPEEKPKSEIPSIEDFLVLDKKFAYKLYDLIKAKGMTSVECYKKANVSKQTWYKIETDKNYRPNKKTVISFAIALELTLEETQMLLKSVGFVLSRSSLFDVIIMYCIENGIYDVLEIDSILFHYDQEVLYSKA